MNRFVRIALLGSVLFAAAGCVPVAVMSEVGPVTAPVLFAGDQPAVEQPPASNPVVAPSPASDPPLAVPTPPAGPWVPALTGHELAAPVYVVGPVPHPPTGPDGYQCWNEYGLPYPQASPICPDGWAGRPPEYPLPIG